MPQGTKAHWEAVYAAKTDQELSWTQADVRTSLSLISKFAPLECRVIDVGGGSSPLAGRLLDKGHTVAVLDISGAALSRAAKAFGKRSGEVRWIEADLTRIQDLGSFDLWHDRAVFHFLTEPADRAAYRALMERTIPTGGHAVIATFAPDGPAKCSGLNVQRYGPASLAVEVGDGFELVESAPELHLTPWGAPQPFQYSVFRRKNSD
jgi:SAM-dependent methyltransferase